MTAVAELVIACCQRGIVMTVEGVSLRVEGPDDALTEDLLSEIKNHKPELLAALSGKINRWRVTHADGGVTEHSSAGLTEAEALALSRSWGEPVRAEPVGVDPPSPPADLGALLAIACEGVPGIDAAIFRALLSPVDVEDIEGGHIPVVTLNAYARSFAEGIRTGRIKVLAAAISNVTNTERVRCADCRHFERDTIGNGSGIGSCKIGGEGTGPRYPALWANAERECKDFEASTHE